MTRSSLALALAVSAVCFAALADETDRARMASAHALWQSAGIDTYRYSYQKYCECYRGEPPMTVVTVRKRRVDQVFHVHDDSDREVPARDGSNDLYWTIDDLFAKLEAAYASEAVVRVDYDPNLGYPVSLFIDYDPGFVGDETDLRLSRFEQL